MQRLPVVPGPLRHRADAGRVGVDADDDARPAAVPVGEGGRLLRHPAGGADWLQAFAKISPVTVVADAARSFALFGTPASLGVAAAWIGGLLAVFIPPSEWRYRRMS